LASIDRLAPDCQKLLESKVSNSIRLLVNLAIGIMSVKGRHAYSILVQRMVVPKLWIYSYLPWDSSGVPIDSSGKVRMPVQLHSCVSDERIEQEGPAEDSEHNQRQHEDVSSPMTFENGT